MPTLQSVALGVVIIIIILIVVYLWWGIKEGAEDAPDVANALEKLASTAYKNHLANTGHSDADDSKLAIYKGPLTVFVGLPVEDVPNTTPQKEVNAMNLMLYKGPDPSKRGHLVPFVDVCAPDYVPPKPEVDASLDDITDESATPSMIAHQRARDEYEAAKAGASSAAGAAYLKLSSSERDQKAKEAVLRRLRMVAIGEEDTYNTGDAANAGGFNMGRNHPGDRDDFGREGMTGGCPYDGMTSSTREMLTGPSRLGYVMPDIMRSRYSTEFSQDHAKASDPSSMSLFVAAAMAKRREVEASASKAGLTRYRGIGTERSDLAGDRDKPM